MPLSLKLGSSLSPTGSTKKVICGLISPNDPVKRYYIGILSFSSKTRTDVYRPPAHPNIGADGLDARGWYVYLG